MNLQQLLNKWNIKCDVNTLLSMWNESNRYYHNLNHLNSLIDQVNENKSKFSEKEYEKLIITSLFSNCHLNNELKSADFFESCCIDKSNQDIKEIKQMIINIKNNKPSSKLSESFNRFNMSIVEREFNELIEWERGVRQEYLGESYKEVRLKFLESVLNKYPHNTDNLLKLVDWVKSNY